ncbi:MAG: acyl-CoA-binding protein [Chlorobi bacterium]|nr:acyl-CoA-binding protein [Chlorobiota bacterium]
MNIKDFEEAVKKSKTLTERPPNEILLKLYALYKQATEGDIKGERPGGFDFKGAAKYDAWEREKGKSKEEAAEEYIKLVNSLKK